MFFVQAGVTIVTSALAHNLFGDFFTISEWAALVLFIVTLILIIGHYKLLNISLKWMMIVLVVLSLIAWVVAMARLGIFPKSSPIEIDLMSFSSIAFIVALMGWMPTLIEISVWHSFWTLSRFKKSGEQEAQIATLDFKVGYLTSLLLAFVFVWLGALLMYGQGIEFGRSAAEFANQLVTIYSTALGGWAWLLMATVTFIALFSTTFAISDGFPRVWNHAFGHILEREIKSNKVYNLMLIILVTGSWWIISNFAKDIKSLIDFVTTVSFVATPIYAWMNYKVMSSNLLTENQKPQGIFKWYTLGCLTLLTFFSLFYLYWRFLN